MVGSAGCVSTDGARQQYCAEHPGDCGADAGPSDGGTTSDAGASDAGKATDAGGLADGGPLQCAAVQLVTYPCGECAELAIGDLHGTGRPDIVASEFGNLDIVLLANNGDGTFAPATQLFGAADAGEPNSVVLADFNRDGNIDVVFTFGGSLYLMLNQGGAVFGAATRYDAGGNPYLAAGDLDGDGWIDLAVADDTNDTLIVLLNARDGGFKLAKTYGTQPLGPIAVVAGSFHGGGALDLMSTDFFSGVEPLLNNGVGVFAAGTELPWGDPGWPALADFNGDGALDFAINAQNGAQVFLGDGTGTFSEGAMLTVGFGRVSAFDVNGDGKVDLLGGSALPDGGGAVIASLGLGDGTFESPIPVAVNGSTQALIRVVSGDLNGNGILDLVVSVPFNNQIAVALDPCSLPAIKTPACIALGQPCDGSIGCCSLGACVSGTCP
jgi:hypothetical protein